ncbi:MAG: Ig-like domain-containing protein [Candidatus Arcticimaribacter sp.]
MCLKKFVAFLFCAFIFSDLSAQDYWQYSSSAKKSIAQTESNPKGVKSIYLNIEAFRTASQRSAKGYEGKTILYFPNEKDNFESFLLTETNVIAPHVAQSAPDIKTYKGYSLQREDVSIRATVSSRGVNYIMSANNEMLFMEYKNNSNEHIYYSRKDVDRKTNAFRCGVSDQLNILAPELYEKKNSIPSLQAKVTSDQTLRTFRIAVAATATYTANWGSGTQADAYNAVVNTINRVNQVLETDLGVSLTLVSTASLMLNDSSTNPMRIGDSSGAGETQNILHGVMNTISSTLAVGDYDIGHGFHKLSLDEYNAGFSTSFGLTPAVCISNDWNGEGPVKAGGISRAFFGGAYTTDAYDIDLVAHEIGHQFGAEHTFSYQTSPNTKSAEPGSGSTIMAYAGVTSHDVQSNSDPYYHYLTIDQINGYLNSQFSCSVTSTIINNVPSINAGTDVSIPQGTAYKLEATGSDTDATLYYCWEQLDTGMQIITTNFGPTQTSGPMARSLTPTTTSIRYIPNMNRVIAGELTNTNPADVSSYPTTNDDWETVATVSRTLNWGVTIRDRSNASVNENGQINQDDRDITVVNTPSPFRVTSQSSAGLIYNGGTSMNITWDVAQTNLAPINTANVNLLLSTDGGYTYPSSLATNVVNNGTATVTLPNGINSTTARVKVEPVGNIYFAINSTNFELQSTNQLPVGVAETIYVTEGGTATTLSGGVTSVLANDTDADGDPLTTTLINNGVNGTLTFAPSGTGTFTYIHDGSQTSTDSFSYRPNDGTNNGNLVAVSVIVTNTNDCPDPTNPISNQTAQEDDPDLVLDIASVFTDEEGAMLTYTVSNTNSTLLTASIVGTSVVLDFVDDETGTATITITANDGGCGSTVDSSFLVSVVAQNDAPVGSPDVINVAEGGTATTTTANNSSVLTDDTDTENDPLTATLVPGSGPLHHLGSFSLSSSGTFIYIHDGSETTTDTFEYTLSDGLSNVTVSVTININPVNDCPVTATPTLDITVDEDDPDTALNFNTVFTDADLLPMPNTLSYTVTHTNASLATLTFNTATLTIDYKDDQNGSMVVTVTANDNADCSTTTDVFNITVNSVNDIPNTVTDTIQVDEGGTATTTTANKTSVLDNDSDVDGPNPIEMWDVSMPQFGTLAWSGTGTFTYVHDSSETTTDSFSYRTYDGQDYGNTVVVSIIITGVNDCPQNTVFRNSTINEDSGGIGYPIASSDTTDPDTAYPFPSYTVTYTNASLATVTFDPTVGDPSFVPKLNQNGTMTGTVTISDGDPSCTLEVPFQLTVLPINDCPTLDNPIADVSVSEDAADQWIDIQNTFSDVESTTLSYSVSSNDPSIVAASLTSTSIILDFQDNAYGNATIIITATDGDINCTTDDLFDVTIAAINDGPTTNPESISVISGNTVTTLNDGVTTSVLDNDIDPESDPISAQLVSTTVNGVLVLNANGTFSYTHDGSATSTDTFYYRATDGFIPGNTVSVTIYINNPPVAVTETIAVMEAGTATTTTNGSTSVLSNDTDADGDPLTAVLVTNPTEGALTLNSNGTFSYVHGGGNLASDSFTYSANDGKINGAPVTVSITVTGTNDPPIANDDNIIVPLNETITTLDNGQTSLTANDIDPDGDVLTASLVSTPTFGTITLNPGGTFSYTQNGTLNSGDSFIYSVSDGSLTSSATVNILLSCSPCTESIIEGGVNGVSFSYTDCLCKTVRVYVPKGKAYTFCHLDNSITVNSGGYTLITSKVCN